MRLLDLKTQAYAQEASGGTEAPQLPAQVPLSFYVKDVDAMLDRRGYTTYRVQVQAPAAGGPHTIDIATGLYVRERPWVRLRRLSVEPALDTAARVDAFSALPTCDVRVFASPAQHDGERAPLLVSPVLAGGGTVLPPEALEGFDAAQVAAIGGDAVPFARMILVDAAAVSRAMVEDVLLTRPLVGDVPSLSVHTRHAGIADNAVFGVYIHIEYGAADQRVPRY